MSANRLALNDIKQRLRELGMIEGEAVSTNVWGVADTQLLKMAGERISVAKSPSSTILPHTTVSPPGSSEIIVREKILQALNSPERADAVVPHSGEPDGLRAVFIKSNNDGTKLTIVENSAVLDAEIQKSASLSGGNSEAVDMTVSMQNLSTEIYQTMPAPVKSPQGMRKFHSWLSYFYSGGGKTSESTSPKSSSPPASPKPIMEDYVDEEEQLNRLLIKIPSRGILKPAKENSGLISSGHPPPIEKSMFLKQEEIQRLTQYTRPKFRNDSTIAHSEAEMGRRKSGFGRRKKIRFDFDQTKYHLTHSKGDYERGGVEYIAKFLTPEIALMIKRELNEVKREMLVHEDSRHYTQFYQLR